MRIGALSDSTGASERSLRHYEANGLIQSKRLANGYRDYDAGMVDRVNVIRSLLAAGLSLESIRSVLPCTGGQVIDLCPAIRGTLTKELSAIQGRLEILDRARRALEGVLATAVLPTPEPSRRVKTRSAGGRPGGMARRSGGVALR